MSDSEIVAANKAAREAIKPAARYILEYLRKAAPSERIAAGWFIRGRGETLYLTNDEIPAVMTALNKRHPLFAGPDNPAGREHWYNENERNPSRTNWDARALERAATEAADRFGNAWVDELARQSGIFELS